MAQHFLFIAVQHPLASAASLMPPQLPLGHKNPRNKKPRGNQLQGKIPAGERGIIDAAPASLGGRNLGIKEELPLGEKTLGTTTTTTPKLQGCGRTTRSFPWGTKPWGQKKSFPWGTKYRGTMFMNTARIMETSTIMDTPRTMVIEQRQRQRRRPTSKSEANEAGFSSGMYFYVLTKIPNLP